jgi:succinyl-CoA synthetase alpha subunit
LEAVNTKETQEQSAATTQQRRSYHTSQYTRRPFVNSTASIQHKRSLHLSTEQSSNLLKSYDIGITTPLQSETSSHYIGISPDRSARSPSIIAAPTTNPDQLHRRVRRFPFDYREGPSTAALAHLQIDAAPPKAKAQTVGLIKSLWKLYHETEAIDIHVCVALSESQDEIQIYSPHFFFDDAAYKSNNRQAELHEQRDKSSMAATDIEAEQNGIVYVPLSSPMFQNDTSQKDTQVALSSTLDQPRKLVGTLVNGAGLAMNTNDVLHARLAPATTSANFLDTGGKATSSTIKTSFKLILSDPRVSVVFVNIFGGLTLCDMIAEGIIMAFKEVGVNKPVVVRLRGTNEELGQRVLREAKLPIHAFDDFEEAVRKVGELAKGNP